MVDAEEVGPSNWSEDLALERTAPPPSDEANSVIVRVGEDPLAWGGPTLSWLDEDGEPFFVLNDMEKWEIWSEFWIMARVRGSCVFSRDIFIFA